VVKRWLHSGQLKFQKQGSGHEHDIYLIHESEIRRFILANPTKIDLRKVDQTWFFDVMFEGKIGEAAKAAA
jgi:hypothetical protein